ncbi:calphotin-like [Pyrus ussuriensis x Pyrus communis]|uniref:Calphotin-like n=1 Tax=Pyrus ussuriensis x Pyrus communis TaxID=2448454 RepID=A0A5N5F2U2_9ROSA|nr:calphotin-like [Pyrus ussuriensis x Pyrus communis]
MATTKKKLAPPVKKASTTMQTPPSKQPRPEVKTAGDEPQPKKGIQVISSHTTGATAPSISLPPIIEASTRGLQIPLMDQATKIHSTIPTVVKPVVAPLVEGKTATLAEKSPPPNPKMKSVIVMEEEEDESEEPQPVIEAVGQVKHPAAKASEGHKAVPSVEPKVAAETPIHPQESKSRHPSTKGYFGFCKNLYYIFY